MKTGTHNLNVTPGLDWKCDKTTSILYVTFTLYSDGVAIHSLLPPSSSLPVEVQRNSPYLYGICTCVNKSISGTLYARMARFMPSIASDYRWMLALIQVIKKSHIRGNIHHISSRFLQLERS